MIQPHYVTYFDDERYIWEIQSETPVIAMIASYFLGHPFCTRAYIHHAPLQTRFMSPFDGKGQRCYKFKADFEKFVSENYAAVSTAVESAKRVIFRRRRDNVVVIPGPGELILDNSIYIDPRTGEDSMEGYTKFYI